MNHSGRLTLQSLHRQQNFAVHCFVFWPRPTAELPFHFSLFFFF